MECSGGVLRLHLTILILMFLALSGFTYLNDTTEIDIEYSKWNTTRGNSGIQISLIISPAIKSNRLNQLSGKLTGLPPAIIF